MTFAPKALLTLCFSLSLLCSSNLKAKPVTESYDVVVYGASQSGTAAAIQAARAGAKVGLIKSTDWFGGSMTSAGVSAIDGNELNPMLSGIWGEFVSELAKREPNLGSYGWVSLFTYNPKLGHQIWADLVAKEKNITVIESKGALSVKLSGKEISSIKLKEKLEITAKVFVEASETGELLALAKIPHSLGWETASTYKEPSAPQKLPTALSKLHPIQELTWVFFLKDYGAESTYRPVVKAPKGYSYEKAAKLFWCAFQNAKLQGPEANPDLSKLYAGVKHRKIHEADSFLTYGQISPSEFMINWPICGNDYGQNLTRAFSDKSTERAKLAQEAQDYSLWFARYIYDTFEGRFGLTRTIFPQGLAPIPYHREVRRLRGIETVSEGDLLPSPEGAKTHFRADSIALGNYANDHHYNEMAPPESPLSFKLAPKSMRWGGRYSGTGFGLPYKALLTGQVDNLLVIEKSWSVSHIANGATRLQPVCLNLGQAAGLAAAQRAKSNNALVALSVSELQAALLSQESSPLLVPLYDLPSDHPHWRAIQSVLLLGLWPFPPDGNFRPDDLLDKAAFEELLGLSGLKELSFREGMTRSQFASDMASAYQGEGKLSGQTFRQAKPAFVTKEYCGQLKGDSESFRIEYPLDNQGQPIMRKTPLTQPTKANIVSLITGDQRVYKFLQESASQSPRICLKGIYNHGGSWLYVTELGASPVGISED